MKKMKKDYDTKIVIVLFVLGYSFNCDCKLNVCIAANISTVIFSNHHLLCNGFCFAYAYIRKDNVFLSKIIF